jgi:hypothetical protein
MRMGNRVVIRSIDGVVSACCRGVSMLAASMLVAVAAGCGAQAAPRWAVPVTRSTLDEGLVGSARLLQKTAGDALARIHYDRNGYAVRVEIGGVDPGGWKTAATTEYDLDGGHLLREIRELDSSGKLRRKLRYHYSTSSGAVEMVPSVQGGSGLPDSTHITYTQKLEGQITVVSAVTNGPGGKVMSSTTSRYDKGTQTESVSMDAVGQAYVRRTYDEKGRLRAVEYLVAPKVPNISSVQEERYSYTGDARFPHTVTALMQDGTTRATTFEYVLDARGNWIERRTYFVSAQGTTLRKTETRLVEYY